MTGVFIQVRLDSSRLPGKALLPLEDKTAIEHSMTALRQMRGDVFALLTDESSSGALRPLAKKCGYELFAGDKDDVLKRYADAADYFGVDTIVRGTGDNPLLSREFADRTLDFHLDSGADFSCFLGMPHGTGVEVVKTAALQYANRNARDPYEREHVNPYLYKREDQFFINRVDIQDEFFFPQARVTLDTVDDYNYLKELYHDLYTGEPIELERIISWVKNSSLSLHAGGVTGLGI